MSVKDKGCLPLYTLSRFPFTAHILLLNLGYCCNAKSAF